MIKKLSDCRNDFLSMIYGKFSELKTCEKQVKKHLPELLAQHCTVSQVQKDVIVITVANASALSHLRYEKFTLLQKLRTEEKMYALKAVDFKLVPAHLRSASSTPSSPVTKKQFSEKSRENVHDTAVQCNDSLLKKALERLEKTLRERLAQK